VNEEDDDRRFGDVPIHPQETTSAEGAFSEDSLRAPRDRPPEERFANAPFPLYGLPPDWKGVRFLGDMSWGSEKPGPDETYALSLVHGTLVEGLAAIWFKRFPLVRHWFRKARPPMPIVDPVLIVETAVPRDTAASGVLRILAECVWRSEAATIAQAWTILRERDEVGHHPYLDPLPTRGQALIPVDGRPFPFDLISGRLAWVAQARVGAHRVTAEGRGFDIGDVQLVKIHDLRPYIEGTKRFAGRIAIRG
jgi:hypothetical protein